jgi:hypothetical protein
VGVVLGGRLLACDGEGRLRATDLATGRAAWWAQVSVPGEACRVLDATDDAVIVEGAGRLVVVDTTREAPPAPVFTVRGRIEDPYTEELRGREVHVGPRTVHTDGKGRFTATLRGHGPVTVQLADPDGPTTSAVVWPDSRLRHHVSLAAYYEDDSCH